LLYPLSYEGGNPPGCYQRPGKQRPG
jgi:hypothetical protein